MGHAVIESAAGRLNYGNFQERQRNSHTCCLGPAPNNGEACLTLADFHGVW